MSQTATSTPLWDARQRLADLADRARASDDLVVTATGDPEVFRFRTGDGRVEGFARIVEVETQRQRSVIAVTGGTATSSGSAAFELVDHAAELVRDGSAGDDALLDPATTAAWLEALTPPAGADTDRAEGDRAEGDRADGGADPEASRARSVAVTGAAAFVLAAIAWWWWRTTGSAGTRAGR